MIEFSSSLKLNEIHIVDIAVPTRIPKYNFFQGRPNFGEGQSENLGKTGNNMDIYCYANRGWLISKENTSPYRLVPKSL